jgi:hypothetical protein
MSQKLDPAGKTVLQMNTPYNFYLVQVRLVRPQYHFCERLVGEDRLVLFES